MRGSSLKSPSQNRTCPIKAYGSSIRHLPNKHFSDISLDTPLDVSLGYSYISSTSANTFGLCVSCFSITPVSHICNTFANLCSSHYCFHQYYGRIRLLDGLRSYSPLHWSIFPTVSCTEPSRSPRYVKYNDIRYAML